MLAGARGPRATLAATFLLALPLSAARLPFRSYTANDGLPHDHVLCVVPDSRGFVWFCTPHGLSRFDGRRFVTYGIVDGLAELYVNHLLEDSRGRYWVATNGAGVYRFEPIPAATGVGQSRPPSAFVPEPLEGGSAAARVNALFEDGDGALWAGTDGGLFVRKDPAPGFRAVTLGLSEPAVWAFARGERGSLWIATAAGLFERAADGSLRREPLPPGVRPTALLRDSQGRLWLGHADGALMRERGQPWQEFRGSLAVAALGEDLDGHVFLGYRGAALGSWHAGQLTRLGPAQGLGQDAVTALATDRGGNLWIGTETGGARRLARNGFVSFDAADGLPHERVISIFETDARELCVQTANRFLNRLGRSGFKPFRPRLAIPPTLLFTHSALQARDGEWWIATGQGLARFGPAPSLDALARLEQPLAVYTRADGLAGDDVAHPHEDARGDMWVAYQRAGGLARFDRAAGRFQAYTESDGLPPGSRATAFSEDAHGQLWVAFREGGVARRRGDRFEFFGADQGVPPMYARDLHRDSRGRLWVATTGAGIVEVLEPQAERPRFRRYTTAQGLTTDHVRCLTDDGRGQLYLGGGIGVDRLDTETGRVTHYTTADGLAQNEIQTAYRDSQGGLWFGTMRGVSRLLPGAAPEPGVSVLIDKVEVGGLARPLSRLGERDAAPFVVPPFTASVRIEYFGLTAAPGVNRLFQYRLEGAPESDWTAPTSRDAVEFVALPAGSYRFQVRPVSTAGEAQGEPASVRFEIQAPLWRRPWFGLLLLGALGTLGYQLHRFRLRRLLDLEHVRTSIASDLHDDIGSSLSQIAILSELAVRGLPEREQAARETLGGIASAAREAVDSMSDIVWAVDPEQDRLADLVQRMRRFGSDVLTSRDLQFQFETTLGSDDLPVGASVRRHVFLVFKECIHNAVRHSRCSGVTASLRRNGSALVVTVADDGVGFDTSRASGGHGLASLKRRALDLGGELQVVSAAGQGTTVTLRAPLEPPRSHTRRW